MNQLQMLKMALIAYVNSMKAVWSDRLYPLSIISKRNGKLKGYHIYGNTVQDGEPTPENPIEMQSVGEPTKNLFDYITGYCQKCTVIENLPTGAIVEGNVSANSETNAWARGWFTPGYTSASAVCPVLHTGDVVTISADITLLELREGSSYKPYIHLFTRETGNGYASGMNTVVEIGETKRISKSYTIGEAYDGKTFYPVFTLNSNVVKIENVQIAYNYVVEYEPYQKYKIPVIVSNRADNLFDKDNARFLNAYIRVADSTYRPASDSASVLIECEPNETYTISHSIDNLSIFRACYINDEPSGSFVIPAYSVAQASTNQKILTVTTGEGCKYIVVQITLGVFNEVANTLTVTKEIDEGSAEPQTFNIYLDEPLRKVGEFADSIDFEKGVVLRKIGKKVYDGTENWQAHNTKNLMNYFYVSAVPEGGYVAATINVAANYLPSKPWVTLYGNGSRADGNLIVGVAGSGNSANKLRYIYVCPYSSQITPDEWKAQLATWYEEGNPFTVLYAVETAEEEIELPSLPQFKGTTVYEVDTTVNPSGMEVCYYE